MIKSNTSAFASFFAPQSIAVIGASHDPAKLGYRLAYNCVKGKYPGKVYLVNPKGGFLFGLPVYTNIFSIPGPIELAILLITANLIPQALNDCGQHGVKAVIVQTSGFRETGSTGAVLEAECVQIARRWGMRFIGPNSVGIIDTHLPMNATFLSTACPQPGEIAFVSHSGAMGAVALDWAQENNFSLSRLISLGNQADITETDILPSVANDPFTNVIALYLEGVADGKRFVSEAKLATAKKPVIALKAGRSESGKKAAASHTGAIAGQEDAFNAAFLRAGVIRAGTIEELFLWSRALAWCPLPTGRAVAILTNAGGPGVTGADAIEACGLQLAQLNSQTTENLKGVLPSAASYHNPIDILASASPDLYASCLRILLKDPEVNSVLTILPPPPNYPAEEITSALIPEIIKSDKPVVIALMGTHNIRKAAEQLRAARVPDFRFPEEAASALAILSLRNEYLRRTAEPQRHNVQEQTDRDHTRVRKLLEGKLPGFLSQDVVQKILDAYGIPILPVRLANDVDEAVAIADKIGYPVVLKVASEDIPHKSDVGGIQVNIKDPEAVRHAFQTIFDRAKEENPDAKLTGVYVQSMLSEGQEIIIGAVMDDQFGPLMMFGSGGIEVEAMKDVSFGLAPLNPEEADRMIDSTWAGKKLQGYRSLQKADRNAAHQVLLCLSYLAADFEELIEIEINPLYVLTEGALVIDARIKLRG